MKRAIWVGLFLMVAGVVHAADESILFPYRSTNVATSELYNVRLVTGCVILRGVNINSAVASSLLWLYDGGVSTSVFVTAGPVIDTSVHRDIEYGVQYSSGLLYSKRGAADVTINWNWCSGIVGPGYLATYGR